MKNDLKDIKNQTDIKTEEKKIFQTLKSFIKVKFSTSEDTAEEIVKRILDLINSVVRESKTLSSKNAVPKKASNQKPKLSGYIASPYREKQILNKNTSEQPTSSIYRIPTEIINSSIKVQDLTQSFENLVDRLLVKNGCSKTNVSICKNEILQERTFNFQTLIRLFEMK